MAGDRDVPLVDAPVERIRRVPSRASIWSITNETSRGRLAAATAIKSDVPAMASMAVFPA
jgi:hypothetical protein